MELSGQSLIGRRRGSRDGKSFQASNPQTGTALEPAYFSASNAEIEEAARLAAEAFERYSQASGKAKASFLRRIADGLDAAKQALAERAHLETALPMQRLLGEVGRTSGQLRLFAGVVEEGSWVNARIDPALPDRQPLPRSDIRSMLRPLGPVVVFGASNFPLAFSVAGGDTASALAAGCPVIVKAHPAHPGTSELAGQIIAEAVAAEGLPIGVFSLLFDVGVEAGTALVKHPLIRAVAFHRLVARGAGLSWTSPPHGPIRSRVSLRCRAATLSSFFPAHCVKVQPRSLQVSSDLSRWARVSFVRSPESYSCPESSETTSFAQELGKLVDEAQPYTLLTPGIAREYGLSHACALCESDACSEGGQTKSRARVYGERTVVYCQARRVSKRIFSGR
jgi:alpha-ketoglutaric semialdehyde dehydrogenase